MIVEKREVYDQPSDVDAVDGCVTLDGPDSVDVAMTPEAADETSDRLAEHAAKAAGQRRLKNYPHREKDA